jgi:hypothetical protein
MHLFSEKRIHLDILSLDISIDYQIVIHDNIDVDTRQVDSHNMLTRQSSNVNKIRNYNVTMKRNYSFLSTMVEKFFLYFSLLDFVFETR